MSTKILNIDSFQPKTEEKYLFDTNALINIFYPPIGSNNSAPYIKLYEKAIAVKSTLLISGINLSEILYLIFDYPHKHYTFKYFEV